MLYSEAIPKPFKVLLHFHLADKIVIVIKKDKNRNISKYSNAQHIQLIIPVYLQHIHVI